MNIIHKLELFNLGNFNLTNEQHKLETIFIVYILLVNFHATVIKLVSPAQQYVYLTLFTTQPLTYTVQVISIVCLKNCKEKNGNSSLKCFENVFCMIKIYLHNL